MVESVMPRRHHSAATCTLGTYGHLLPGLAWPGLATGPVAALGERIAGRASPSPGTRPARQGTVRGPTGA